MQTKVITPDTLVKMDDEFVEHYHDALYGGVKVAADSKVVVVGLARQIAEIVPLTQQRLERLDKLFGGFGVCVVENDSTDGTADLFDKWEPPFDFDIESSVLDRPHLPASRGAERTTALAEYRTQCQDMVSELHDDADYVIVMDYDSWGGFLPEGILTSLHYLNTSREYAGMASIGLGQIEQFKVDGKYQWFNYDAWAHRPTWSWRQRPEMWYHHLIPPFGCPPIEVNSAFGGLCVYRTEDYLAGTYGGTLFGVGDCEHVVFHRSISQRQYRGMALNPSSVGVMFWREGLEEANAAAA